MLLGIVVHGSLPYFSRMLGIEYTWPADDDQSILLLVLFVYIHAWRMPTFFILAGFFAHLVIGRRGDIAFARDRLKRIGLPLILFGSAMAVVFPPLWIYGWTGALSVEAFLDSLGSQRDLGSSGDLFAHLWFLYYLLLMYLALLVARWLAGTRPVRAGLQTNVAIAARRNLARAAYSRIPLVLVLTAIALLVLRAGDESKPLWPLNVTDILYGGLFFAYGYGLYGRRELIGRLKRPGVLIGLWTMAALAFLAHLAFSEAQLEAVDEGMAESLWLVATIFYGAVAALTSIGLIGLFERLLAAPRDWIRWVADASYWIYIIHLPVIAFITFWFAHLDRRGWQDSGIGTGFGAEVKFLLACAVTTAIGLLSYRYMVRYTLLGTMLNGHRSRVRPRSQ